jgi:beta-glucosidase
MRTYIDFIQEAGVAETAQAMRDAAREVAVAAALGRLDLDAKARLLAGQDM